MRMMDRNFEPPRGLRTDGFELRPIRESDAAADYEAVMSSVAFLRDWEQSGWPEDGFTLEDNRADLKQMEARHLAMESFAYTVSDPQGGSCLGCVYLFPTDAEIFVRSKISPRRDNDWGEFAITVYFWVRMARLADGLDAALLKALSVWLRAEWRIGRSLFVTSVPCQQQVEMFEKAGLSREFRIFDPKTGGKFLAYA